MNYGYVYLTTNSLPTQYTYLKKQFIWCAFFYLIEGIIYFYMYIMVNANMFLLCLVIDKDI